MQKIDAAREKLDADKEIVTHPYFLMLMLIAIIIPIVMIIVEKKYNVIPIVFIVLAFIALPSGCLFFPIGLYLRYELKLSKKYHSFKANKANTKRAEKATCIFCNQELNTYEYMVVAFLNQHFKTIVRYAVVPVCHACQNNTKYQEVVS